MTITFVDPATDGAPEKKSDTAPAPKRVTDPNAIKFMEPASTERKLTPREEVRKELMDSASFQDNVLRGMTFGLSDRAVALGKDLFGMGDYASNLEQQFAERDAYREEHPVSSIAGEVMGAVSTGGPLTSLAKGAARAVAPRVASALGQRGVMPAMGRVGATLGGGAVAGGISGAGQADYGETLEGAKEGAITGALTAGALKAGGKVLQGAKNIAAPFVQRAATALGMTNPDKWAQKEWLEAVGLDGDDLAILASRIRNAESDGPRGTMAMDVAGVNAKSKLKSATIPSTQAKAQLDETLNKRSLEQGDRLTEDIRKGINPRLDTSNVAEEIYTAARQKADPLYEQARKIGAVNDPRVMQWFNATNNRRQVLRDYAKAMEDNGTPMNLKFDIDQNGLFVHRTAPTVEDLMRIKDHYGQLRKRLVDPVTGQVDNKATVKINGNEYGYDVINKEFRDMRDLVRSVTPDGNGGSLLAQADAISGDAAEVGKALQAGKKIRTLSSEDLKKQFGELESEAEKEAFRIGAAGALFSTVEKGKGGPNAVHQLYGSKAMKEKLDAIFPDQSAKEYFAKVMGTEAKLAESTRQMAPRVSAASAAMEREAADMSPANFAVNLAQGRLGAAGSALGRFFSNQWESSMPQYADPLLRLGMLGADETEALARQLAQRGALQRAGSVLNRGARNVASGIPYAGANVAGIQTDSYPSLEAFLNREE